jgi:putative membrane protein insertion efficiency factor
VRRVLWWAGAPARALILGVVNAYRALVAPLLGERCRFHPSCSAYAIDAVRTHGAVKGSLLSMWRLLRCTPLSAGGVEPVPPRGMWIRFKDRGTSRTKYDSVIQEGC